MINAIGQGANPSAHVDKVYTAYTCCVKAVNKLQPAQFIKHCAAMVHHYPHLRSRIALLTRNSLVCNMSCTEIANWLLDCYLAHAMDSVQLRMLDEIFNLTYP